MKTARKILLWWERNAGRLRGVSGVWSPQMEKKSPSSAPDDDSLQSHLLNATDRVNLYLHHTTGHALPSLMQSLAKKKRKKKTIYQLLPLSPFQNTETNGTEPNFLYSYHAASSRRHFTKIWFPTPVCISVLIPSPNCTDLQHGYDPTNCNLPELGTWSLNKVKCNLSIASELLCHTTGLPDQHQDLHYTPGRNNGGEGFWRRMATFLEMCVELLLSYEE